MRIEDLDRPDELRTTSTHTVGFTFEHCRGDRWRHRDLLVEKGSRRMARPRGPRYHIYVRYIPDGTTSRCDEPQAGQKIPALYFVGHFLIHQNRRTDFYFYILGRPVADKKLKFS